MTKNKNIINFLLILIINLYIILSYNEEFPFYSEKQMKILDEACNNKSKIYCPMFSAIEDIFSSIQNEQIILSEYLWCFNFCLNYNNIYARDIICDDNIIIFDTNNYSNYKDDYLIQFNNCNVLIEGTLSYKSYEISEVSLGTFLSEINFDSISFNVSKGMKGKMEIKFQNSTKKYNYNQNDAIFKSEITNMTQQMEIIMEFIYSEFISIIQGKTERDLDNFLSFTLNNFKNRYSYYNTQKFKDDSNINVSYLSYSLLEFDTDAFVHVNNKYFLNNLNVRFEYALNNNITFNENNFTISNFALEEDVSKDNIYDGYHYNEVYDLSIFEYTKNSEIIWKTIIKDFKEKLNEYRKYDKNEISS